jgi:transcriptional regulator with XRE-family HTH domain
MDERERLIEIMKSQNLNSKQLSLELGVSAGTISNILGGRNKPSLEFLQNVANHFPFISPAWLFLGFGEKYIDGYLPTNSQLEFGSSSPVDNSSKSRQSAKENVIPSIPLSNVRTIEKIVIFYSDGTFEER